MSGYDFMVDCNCRNGNFRNPETELTPARTQRITSVTSASNASNTSSEQNPPSTASGIQSSTQRITSSIQSSTQRIASSIQSKHPAYRLQHPDISSKQSPTSTASRKYKAHRLRDLRLQYLQHL